MDGRPLSAPTPNQQYRAELAEYGNCRDCEAPLLASEADQARCGPCRTKRNAAKARKRRDSPAALARYQQRVRDAIARRVDTLGYDDGAGDRRRVRAFREGRR